jgi:hypothetical protein
MAEPRQAEFAIARGETRQAAAAKTRPRPAQTTEGAAGGCQRPMGDPDVPPGRVQPRTPQRTAHQAGTVARREDIPRPGMTR